MNPLAPPSRPGLAPWLHAFRDIWWVVLALFAVVPVLVVVEASSDVEDRFEATATVAAVDLDVPVAGLSRTVVAAFNTSDVAESIRAQIPYGGDPRLPPSAISVEPVLDTVVVRVHATDADVEVAAALANAGAEALVDELGDLRGLGTFEVTDRARVPERPVESDASPVLVIVGLIAATGLSVVILVMRMSFRRPVLAPVDVYAAAEPEWVAEVLMPRRASGAPLPGIGRVRVPDAPTILVAGVGLKSRERRALTAAIGAGLAESESVDAVLIGGDGDDDVFPAGVRVHRHPSNDPALPEFDGRRIVDFDTAEAVVDAFRPAENEAFAVIAVGRRASVEDLRNVVGQIDPAIGVGVVLVRFRRR